MHLHPNNFMVCSGLAGGLISGFHLRPLGFSALWDYCHALFIIHCLLIVHVSSAGSLRSYMSPPELFSDYFTPLTVFFSHFVCFITHLINSDREEGFH